MLIPVLIEPQYKDALWCRQTLGGIEAACAQKKYVCKVLSLEECLQSATPPLPIIMIGTSQSWVPGTIAQLRQRNIYSLLVSYVDVGSADACATISIKHQQAVEKIVQCLQAWDRLPAALYGANPNSSADRVKCRTFERLGGHADAIFWNQGSLETCANRFLEQAKQFRSVIAANDLAAVAMIRRARQQGIMIPGDLYVFSFVGCRIARVVSPTITTVAVDHAALGAQAVSAYSYLSHCGADIRLSIQVPYKIICGETTEHRPIPAEAPCWETPDAPAVDFYQDQDLQEVFQLEGILHAADETDILLLQGLREGHSYERLAENAHIALGTVKYRLKKMLQAGRVDSRDALRALLMTYMGET